VVAEADGVRALQAVHAAFGLGGAISHRAEGTEAPTETPTETVAG
jgi:aspartate kinase